jgi:hypothetical protein
MACPAMRQLLLAAAAGAAAGAPGGPPRGGLLRGAKVNSTGEAGAWCNPTVKDPPQLCPGGLACPDCGSDSCLCPSITCNPTLRDPPQLCPGGLACPDCGSDSCPCPAAEPQLASGSMSCGEWSDSISVEDLCKHKYPGLQDVTAECDGGYQGWSCVIGGQKVGDGIPDFFALIGQVYINSQNQPCCAYNVGTGCYDWHLKECTSQ